MECGADKDKTAFDGSSPLHVASGNGHLDIVRCLVECGADKDKTAFDALAIWEDTGHPGAWRPRQPRLLWVGSWFAVAGDGSCVLCCTFGPSQVGLIRVQCPEHEYACHKVVVRQRSGCLCDGASGQSNDEVRSFWKDNGWHNFFRRRYDLSLLCSRVIVLG